MKQNRLLLLLCSLFAIILIPSNVFAKQEVTNLKQTIDDEINVFSSADGYEEYVNQLKSIDLGDYSDSKDKVNVYLFRGSSCSHCFDAVVYFANIAKEYGQYFNLKAYEVWQNEDNSNLMKSVADKLGDEVNGVPYIVIGKKTWSGFTDSYGEEMKKEIKEQYDKDSSKRYDIMKHINSKESSSTSSDVIALIVILLVVGAITGGIVVARKKAA